MAECHPFGIEVKDRNISQVQLENEHDDQNTTNVTKNTLFEKNKTSNQNTPSKVSDENEDPEDILELETSNNEVEQPQKQDTILKKRAQLSGVGNLIKQLRGEVHPPQKKRIVLDANGNIYRDPSTFPMSNIAEVQESLTLACNREGIAAPSMEINDVRIARQMIRKKMVRCKKCKTRFVEKTLYERHLRDKHPELYEPYLLQLEEESNLQRELEIERNRIEELETGGFIPPESEVADIFKNPNLIPLGERSNDNTGGNDYIRSINRMKKPYVKKVSPQCPFCDKRFRNELSLKKHFIKKHEDLGDFQQCLKCFKCVAEGGMAEHLCELTYVCFDCNPVKNLCTEDRLFNHRKKFHRGANSGFHCKMCKMKCLTPRKLRKHMKINHVFTETHQCHFCDEVFINEIGVTTHERIHTGIIKFECLVCDFRCNRYIGMEEHKKKDHGYVCPICQELYSEENELKHHVYEKHGGYMASNEPLAFIETPRTWMLYKGE